MTYYIQSSPAENGNYGNPQTVAFEGAYHLPSNLLNDYLNTMGFAVLAVETVQGEEDESERTVVTAVELNEAAYDAYIETHPPGPEPEPPTPEDEYNAALRALLTGVEVIEG